MPFVRRAVPPAVVTASVTALVVASVAAAAGCGSGVAPRAWATSVCGALSPWRSQISTLTGQVQQQMTGATTPPQARQQLITLLGGARDASEVARRKLAAAGTPSVSRGARIAAEFVTSLASARDAYGRAGTTVSTLDTAHAEPFYDGVVAAFQRLEKEYTTSALDTARVDSAELRRAFDEVPGCR
jgi:hypothetical protein